ncbi:DUF2947 domain-containing protein [Shewanella eurypsychrophilus]|uniref:DUF2947 domain-containing protein n=1 Tax=Shewanella eurypsychrophilus TaxID=2593656 RepID=A0ABX6V8B6_9GAMM|nr:MULTISPECIES: DUF2947 domain-containing protein [Shewanella]QFU23537.1 DUF2947 family protein [Shewanella sp. YLB-09]QPG58763.1 DUF2947 domain-containing protein [Shewanella eurypsychrophilus]
MNTNNTYISLEQYTRKWIFNHKDLPVTDEDKAFIKPLDQKGSMQVWNKWISNRSSRTEQFSKGDWAAKGDVWTETDDWQSAWDSEDPALPEMFAAHFDWADDAVVYFCYEKYQVIETRWDVFVRNWKCFFFFDDGPLLISPKQKQAALILQNGQYQIGHRG